MSKFLDSDRVSELWSKVKEYINSQIAQNSAGGGIPSGVITIWSGTANNIPTGWALCDGTNGTPDLRDKFVLGAGTHEISETGGSETVTLSTWNMPSHNHIETIAYKGSKYIHRLKTDGGTNTGAIIVSNSIETTSNSDATGVTTESRGSSQPHENMPPYYTLCYIMKL